VLGKKTEPGLVIGEIAFTGSPPISPGEAFAVTGTERGSAIAKPIKMCFSIESLGATEFQTGTKSLHLDRFELIADSPVQKHEQSMLKIM
jgi:hypothetical protein